MDDLRFRLLLPLLLSLSSGCVMIKPAPQPLRSNPMVVRANSQEDAWERVVEVIHKYHFEIERENRLDGIIETKFRTGSNLFEPWHPDSVGFENRLESTLQSIRRKAIFHVVPAQGGYNVTVEVHKEIEDVRGVVANSTGGATFHRSDILQRDLDLVLGQSRPSGWISKGRDPLLEQKFLREIERRFSY